MQDPSVCASPSTRPRFCSGPILDSMLLRKTCNFSWLQPGEKDLDPLLMEPLSTGNFNPRISQVYVLLPPSQITALSQQRGLYNSMWLWADPCRATQDGHVIVESSDKMWSTGGGNGKPQYSCRENLMNYVKGQKDMILQDELPRSEGVQYATGEEWRRTTSSPRKNEVAGSKWMLLAVDVCSDKIKVWCCKGQYCIRAWTVRSMNQVNWMWSSRRW